MGLFGDQETPKEVYDFFKDRKCILCGEPLTVDAKSFWVSDESSCKAMCHNDHDHYVAYAKWKTKWIRTGSYSGVAKDGPPSFDTEICEFYFDNKTYTMKFIHEPSYRDSPSSKARTIEIKIDHDFLDEDIEFVVDADLLDMKDFYPGKMASKIEKIRLLK